ncbi:MAG: cytochrome c [Epsilonproteobacteria bacterium]|nr:MAG: cytochrome c [Campylobacterota bacterium]
MKKLILLAMGLSVMLSAADGEALYKKCAACHGVNGEKKALGKSAEINVMSKDELVTALKGYKAGTLNKKGMGALMKGQIASYDDAQIEAVSEYISSKKQ